MKDARDFMALRQGIQRSAYLRYLHNGDADPRIIIEAWDEISQHGPSLDAQFGGPCPGCSPLDDFLDRERAT